MSAVHREQEAYERGKRERTEEIINIRVQHPYKTAGNPDAPFPYDVRKIDGFLVGIDAYRQAIRLFLGAPKEEPPEGITSRIIDEAFIPHSDQRAKWIREGERIGIEKAAVVVEKSNWSPSDQYGRQAALDRIAGEVRSLLKEPETPQEVTAHWFKHKGRTYCTEYTPPENLPADVVYLGAVKGTPKHEEEK